VSMHVAELSKCAPHLVVRMELFGRSFGRCICCGSPHPSSEPAGMALDLRERVVIRLWHRSRTLGAPLRSHCRSSRRWWDRALVEFWSNFERPSAAKTGDGEVRDPAQPCAFGERWQAVDAVSAAIAPRRSAVRARLAPSPNQAVSGPRADGIDGDRCVNW
jgi:hypothetical protein